MQRPRRKMLRVDLASAQCTSVCHRTATPRQSCLCRPCARVSARMAGSLAGCCAGAGHTVASGWRNSPCRTQRLRFRLGIRLEAEARSRPRARACRRLSEDGGVARQEEAASCHSNQAVELGKEPTRSRMSFTLSKSFSRRSSVIGSPPIMGARTHTVHCRPSENRFPSSGCDSALGDYQSQSVPQGTVFRRHRT